MAAADRTGDRGRERLRRLCRLERRDELGRGGGQGRAVARECGQRISLHSGARRRGRRIERPAALRQALSGRPRSAREGEELAKLLKAVLKPDWAKAPKIIDEPFVGLRSMREEEADRFFGRKAEVKDLVKKFGKHRIVADRRRQRHRKILARAGGLHPGLSRRRTHRSFARECATIACGTSSRCGPAPTPRKACASASLRPRRKTRPIARPTREPAASGRHRRRERRPPSRCSAICRRAQTSTLLIVDQFEELFTATPDQLVAPFLKLLLDLADSDKDFRILLTVRADYFDLLSEVKDACGRAGQGHRQEDPVRAPKRRGRRRDPAAEAGFRRGPAATSSASPCSSRASATISPRSSRRCRATSPTSRAICRYCRSR